MEAVRLWNTARTMVLAVICLHLNGSRSLPYITLSAEKLLLKELISRYSNVTSQGRPVIMSDTPVNVQFGLGLIQMDLDEKTRALVLSVWIKMVWVDQYMSWNPTDFGNISSVKMESKQVWLPDIMLYNTAETEVLMRDTFITVFHNGTILWVPHQKLQSSCSIDVTNFPFDTQTCHMWFGSWTYTTEHLNLTMAFPEGMDLKTYSDDYKESGQWEITQLVSERRVLPSVDEYPNYAVLTFTLTLRRNIVFSSYILTLPCVFLACLTLVVFWLPPDRPDRTSLAMSIFSSFLLLLLILVEAAPPTASSVPRLGIYYCFNMVIIMLAVFLSSLVVNVWRMGEGCTPVPKWLRKITIDSPLERFCFCEGLLAVTWMSYECDTSFRRSPYRDPCFGIPLLENASRLSVVVSGNQGNKESYANGGNPLGVRQVATQYVTSAAPGRRCSEQAPPATPAEVIEEPEVPIYENDSGCGHVRHNPELTGDGRVGEQIAQNVNCIRLLLKQLESRLDRRLQHDISKQLVKRDWRKASLILDRVFFVLYLFLIVVSIATLFPRP